MVYYREPFFPTRNGLRLSEVKVIEFSSLSQDVATTSVWWKSMKDLIEYSVSFSPDSIHVMIGVCIQLSAAGFRRRSIVNWLPWLAVLVLILLNETADLIAHRSPLHAGNYGESIKDILLTMFLPTLLMLSARQRPTLFAPREQPQPGEADTCGGA